MITTEIQNNALAAAVHSGLSKKEKTLPSWIFYDGSGDKIFQEIMAMPEYYLTNCEFSIFEQQKEAIYQAISAGRKEFNLIELGAGDGLKTEVLLKHFTQKDIPFNYCPVDISASVLNQLKNRLEKSLPDLAIKAVENEYFDALNLFKEDRTTPLTVLFLGANIGNFALEEASKFVKKISNALKKGDQILLGVDLKKDPQMILDAYNDAAGITESFNLNILTRMNSDLGANFDLAKFSHYACYDPQTGTAKSFLVSQEDQQIHFEAFDEDITFKQWELIHVEVSQKFDKKMIEEMCQQAGLSIEKYFYDEKAYFADVLIRK